MDEYTDKWLKLYAKALKSLQPKNFELFKFGVGLSGTDRERYLKGMEVWKVLHPKPVVISNCAQGKRRKVN